MTILQKSETEREQKRKRERGFVGKNKRNKQSCVFKKEIESVLLSMVGKLSEGEER